jgi:ribosomal protein L32
MAVPKRRITSSRAKKKRTKRYSRGVVGVVKTEDKKGFKRPHVDEYIEV